MERKKGEEGKSAISLKMRRGPPLHAAGVHPGRAPPPDEGIHHPHTSSGLPRADAAASADRTEQAAHQKDSGDHAHGCCDHDLTAERIPGCLLGFCLPFVEGAAAREGSYVCWGGGSGAAAHVSAAAMSEAGLLPQKTACATPTCQRQDGGRRLVAGLTLRITPHHCFLGWEAPRLMQCAAMHCLAPPVRAARLAVAAPVAAPHARNPITAMKIPAPLLIPIHSRCQSRSQHFTVQLETRSEQRLAPRISSRSRVIIRAG